MAQEITANGLTGSQTLVNIGKRAHDVGIEVRRDDVRFILDVVSEADPWFEQGASASLFASRFRNFVVARCRGQGLNLSADELDLIEAWFAGACRRPARRGSAVPAYGSAPAPAACSGAAARRSRRIRHSPHPATSCARIAGGARRTGSRARPTRATRPTTSFPASSARVCAANAAERCCPIRWSKALDACGAPGVRWPCIGRRWRRGRRR